MARWDPDARGRLERAALELFAEQGYAETTVPQITQRAGLTTRTFFRYFADKREVLFAGEEQTREGLVRTIQAAPPGLATMDLLAHTLGWAATEIFGPRFEQVRHWRAVVDSDDALRERELRKQQLMAEATVRALRDRGLGEQEADMAARLAVLLLQTAVARWVAQDEEVVPLIRFVREALEQLRVTVV